ncbi:hypothetical protein EGR_05587 [Echinococcus granulosus]|uniref:Uncharacterized protein n=1 Tax=Echinococcus granulosus TaxID=6210 RepID=W6UDV7_ECHGR|nr:hypothetical protein EGR_05587 [Echinococcus granulosus]EUB59560.1 hypothetical protein EGR_05587 [Echinococcus granulosus]
MAKFFGVSLFKKASSGHSADSPKMKKDFGALSVRERTKNISNAPTVMWDAICDLNSSSDLDDSTDFFYSRSGIFSPQPEKPSSPIQSASEKPQKPVSSSSTNKWKTNFLVPEISPRHPRTTETTPISPSISRFQSKSRASPSMGFRYSSTLGRSPAFKSNSSTAELEVTEHDIPSDTDTTNSPKVTHVITDIEKNGLNSVESRTSLDLSTISLDQTNEEGNQDSNYQCRSMGEMNNVQRQSAHEEGQCREVEACDSDGYDKLAILHVKLKNEAVKLENWKNEMIAKLNKNEEKLAEANTLVASLRKSNLELQMDRENASLKIELLNVKASKREKEGQLSEALFKCSQLSDDLSRVYTLLQNSENNCLKRGQKITSMEGEIKKLTEEKRFLQDDLHKKEVETLRCELNKSEEKYKDLEESLSNEKRLRAEAEEKLVCLQENEKIRNKEILDLRNLTSNQQNEIEDLTTKVRNIEFDQNNLNSRNQDMSRCIELKNDQIVRLEERLHEAEQQVLVLENAAARAGQEVRTSSSSLAQRDAEVSQLREALHTAQAEHATALRHCEEVRAELLGAVEQQQQESDKVLRQKEKEIGSLKEMLNALQKEADKSSKRIEKKLTDNVVHMEKLNDQLKETVQEKKELSKQLTASKQKMTKLEKDADEKKVLLSEMEEKVGNLDAELTNLNNEKAKLTAALSTKDAEIERLRYIEAEFADFKRSIMNNSPPCSTQIPKSIEIEVQKTPRSPLLSEKLNRMVLLKTPQKTPKSILKQPGSECKRRRVLLISPEKSTPKSGCFEVEPELEVELQAGSKTVDTNSETCLVVAQPCFKPAPPRTPNIRGTPQTRNANIRKTPSSGSRGRGPPTNTRSSMRLGSAKGPTATTNAAHVTTSVAASSWFDSDETFGLNTEE